MLLALGAWGLLLYQLGGEWVRNPQYGYGLVVPLVCAGILWERRDELARAFAGAEPRGPCPPRARALLYLGALSLLPIELLREVSPQLRSIGIYGALLCMVLTAWTLRRMGVRVAPKVLVGVAVLFATAIPWPTAIELWVTQSLMKRIASLTADVLSFGGILALHRGNLIELRDGVLSVDEACSGVRSLQSCIMASVAIGQFHRVSWPRQAALVACGILLALAGNFLRTLALALLASWHGAASVGRFHDPAGLVILVVVTLVLLWVGRRMDVPGERAPVKWEWPDGRGLPRARGVCLVAAASMVVAHAWYWSHDTRWPPQTEPFLALKSQPDTRVDEIPVPPPILKVLQPDRAGYFQCRSRESGEVAVYTFFWMPTRENQMGFFHRPDVCMSGAGWEMMGDVRRIEVNIGGVPTDWYVFTFEREGKRLLQAWGVWRDGVGQQLDFSRGWRFMGGQHMQIWKYVREGRRLSNIQIVSVILSDGSSDDRKMARVIGGLFEARRRTP